MATRAALAAALAALGVASPPSSPDAAVADGRAALLSAPDAPVATTVARVGAAYALLSLPRGPDGAAAARALLESALLPMADDLAVAPKQRDAARKALVSAALALEQLAKGRAVRVAPVAFELHPAVAARVREVEAAGAVVTPDAFDDGLAEDVAALNAMQALAARWGAEIDRVVGAARDGPGALLAADEEQLFWVSVDAALDSALKALAAPAATVSLQLLARKRRLVAFLPDGHDALTRGRQRAQGILSLVQSLPVGPVRTADDIPALVTAVRALLSHVASRLRLSSFPLNRALALASALSQDVSASLCKVVLRRGGLLGQSHKACLATSAGCEELFRAWDKGFEACRLAAVERAEARGEKLDPHPRPAFTPLQTRIRDVATFRARHEALLAVVTALSGAVDETLAAKLAAAHDAVAERFAGSASTDVSAEGETAWSDALGAYAGAVCPMEELLASTWDTGMSEARTLEAKAAVGAPFAAVVDRAAFAQPVQAAMSSVTELARAAVSRIRAEAAPLSSAAAAAALQDDFSAARGLPPVSLRVISLRRLANTVDVVLAQVTRIVGDARMQADLDMRDLATECLALRRALQPAQLVSTWLESLPLHALDAPASLFTASKGAGVSLSLPRDVAGVPGEVAMLQDLGFAGDIGAPVAALARRVASVHPAIALLTEGLHAYKLGVSAVACLGKDSAPASRRLCRLLRRHKHRVRLHFEQGASLRWTLSAAELEASARRLRDDACAFSAAVLLSVDRDGQVESSLQEIDALTCRVSLADGIVDADAALLRKLLDRIRAAVGDMQACTALSDVSPWYSRTHSAPRVKRAMRRLLTRTVEEWTRALKAGELGAPAVSISYSADSNRMEFLPPLDAVEQRLYEGLFRAVDCICGLAGGGGEGDGALGANLFPALLGTDRRRSGTLHAASAQIQAVVRQAELLLDEWRRYEGLWEVDVGAVPKSPADTLASWSALLSDVQSTRRRVEGGAGVKSFGIAVDVSPAAKGVLARVSAFADPLSARCSAVVVEEMKAVYFLASESLSVVRESGAGDAMDALLVLQAIQSNILPTCETKSAQLEQLQALLRESPGYAPPEDAVEHESVAAVVASLRSEFDQRQRHADADRPALEARYHAETGALEDELAELFGDASKRKDETADLSDADAALGELAAMERRLETLRARGSRMKSIASALRLPESSSDMELETLSDELRDMRLAMSEAAAVQAELGLIAATRLGDVEPKGVRQELERLGDRLRELQEARGRLALAHRLEEDVGAHLRLHGLVSSLRTAKLSSPREREVLEVLFGADSGESGLFNVRLRALWACNLSSHDRYLRGVFESAAGESSLASFLAAVAEAWTSRRVEFVSRGRVHLIRGIPGLLDDAAEHLHALSAMAGSSHARLFESERASWELRIAKFRDEVDVWAEVQTRWLHLSTLFSESSPSSGPLRRQMREEFASFQSVQARLAEFSSRAKAAPGVLEVLEKPSGLDRMAVELAAVVRGLGKYLESQRSLFPRFFYLSDDDLLSVLSVGGSDLGDLTPHLSKLFPGVARLDTAADSVHKTVTVSSVVSKEGEVVALSQPVVIPDKAHIVTWLCDLEKQIEDTLRGLVPTVLSSVVKLVYSGAADAGGLAELLACMPAQIVLLAAKLAFTSSTERALGSRSKLCRLVAAIESSLLVATGLECPSSSSSTSAKFRQVREQVIKELVYQRTVLRAVEKEPGCGAKDFCWYGQLRFYVRGAGSAQPLSVEAQMADASVTCGWEYLGVGETLVQTPLTCRCFLTLTQAMRRGLGGSPFGPAGTGKTESVKALGRLLGRAVSVFNCDETFDAVSVGRILAGVCRTGSWVCFDEFNRLSAGILSSTSNQLAGLQAAIQTQTRSVPNFYGGAESVAIADGVAVFVTMNPTYTGRRELPGNLRSLLRPMAMTKPDSGVITEVSLLAQGFTSAGRLSSKLFGCFDRLAESLPPRPHYDFGLRSLKSAVEAAGVLRRAQDALSSPTVEETCVVRALLETVKPKIVPEDAERFESHLEAIFPGSSSVTAAVPASLHAALVVEAEASRTVLDDRLLEKVGQLLKILEYRPGVMLVGPTGSSKTTAWRLLRRALLRAHSGTGDAGTSDPGDAKGVRGRLSSLQVLDPKLISSAQLYGSLDVTTREWTDGIFTRALRDLASADTHGRTPGLYHWFVFDGDVDPDWAENLNSVLDDSRVLTLPTGERIPLPRNARIIFETEDVKSANPSTISRCGMVCFSAPDSLGATAHHLQTRLAAKGELHSFCVGEVVRLVPAVTELVEDVSARRSAIMEVSSFGILRAVFALFDASLQRLTRRGGEGCAGKDENGEDARLAEGEGSGARVTGDFAVRSFLVAAAAALGGSLSRDEKVSLSDALLARVANIGAVGALLKTLPPGCCLCDVTVDVESGRFASFASLLEPPAVDGLNPLRVGDPDIVIPTATTLRNSTTLAELIGGGCDSMVVLCGPPGCGKSMVISDALSSMANVDLASMSFSSTTSPADILATLRAHASVQKLPGGALCLRPKTPGSRIVLFCDEVNLGAPDAYGTQTAACFLRQLLEHGGFWGDAPLSWIRVEGLQIVAACNPPELAGRQALPSRLLRHAHVMRVEPPAGEDLTTIFGVLSASMLRAVDARFEGQSPALTAAMIQIFEANQGKFSPPASGPLQPHYVYSARDMSRWLRGMRHILLERGVAEDTGLRAGDVGRSGGSNGTFARVFSAAHAGDAASATVKDLTWADVLSALVHEARRLFVDRLMLDAEREFAESVICSALSEHLGFQKPSVPDQWYSAWPKRHHRRHGHSSGVGVPAYQPVRDVNSLRKLVYRKLRSFCEEEGLGGAWMSGSGAGEGGGASMIDQFAVTDDVLRHLTRIERILRLPLGHAVLIGAPGSGKKTLARFAAWMGGISVHQVRSHSGYTAVHFADDLRGVLRVAGVSGNAVMMIFDESNALDGEFLEMMNAILACGDVPGLFEGEARAALLSSLRKQNLGMSTASTDEALYRTFVHRVRANLHVVFTLSCDPKAVSSGSAAVAVPAGGELLSRSPALYNRCVVDWMGDWDAATLEAVADLKLEVLLGAEKESIVRAAVRIHQAASAALAGCAGAARFTTPRHYLEFMEQLNRMTLEKAGEIQSGASRLKSGLNRLREAGATVDSLKEALSGKAEELTAKEAEATETLASMAEEQRLAEKAKVTSEALAAQAEGAAAAAEERKAEVAEQLAAVEPKVETARRAVGSIRKENLEELRAMPNPPPGVRLALEAVMMMLDAAAGGHLEAPMSWQETRKRMRGSDLIPSVVNFDPDAVPSALVARLRSTILSNKDFDVEKVAYSSRAAGPLAEWTMASLEYAEVNESVAPLRAEAEELEREREDCVMRKEEAEAAAEELGARIDECRVLYAGLVSEAECVRRAIGEAAGKLRSAEKMMESLAGEYDRWKAELTVYNETADFVWGNAVLGAAFVSYAGPLDEAARRQLLDRWESILHGAQVDVEGALSMAEYLSSAVERAAWTQAGLAMDETSVQSYAILKRSARYPLIVDPSRRADNVVRSVLLSSRPALSAAPQGAATAAPAVRGVATEKSTVSKTSFAATGKHSYLRVIESAMRFGTAVLVEDAEQFDHSIAPVLGQEATTGDIGDAGSMDSGATGGSAAAGLSHRLVRLGDRDVDQNPSFRLFLSATDLAATPSAAVSRCCVVSFSFSGANLRTRCLSRALHFIAPALEAQRAELTTARLAREQRKVALEADLLSAIAGTPDEGLLEGSLLATLQTLKAEADEIETRLRTREQITREVDDAMTEYEPLASLAVHVFFALTRLSALNPLYRYSAEHFLTMFDGCVREACERRGGDGTDVSLRAREQLFSAVFLAVSPSLFPEDQMPFAASLAVIACKGDEAACTEMEGALQSFVLRGSGCAQPSPAPVAGSDFTACTTPALVSTLVARCATQPASVAAILDELAGRIPGGDASLVHSPAANSNRALQDEIAAYASARSSPSLSGGKIDAPLPGARPLLLCARGSGVDPSALVATYCRDAGVVCESVAVGDAESVSMTRSALEYASEHWGRVGGGGGVLLFKNMHLAPVECVELVRREIVKHGGELPYVLIVASEVGRCASSIPNVASLTSQCRLLAFEAPCDFRSTLARCSSIARCGSGSDAGVNRFLAAVAWLHASVVERCRYFPTGVSKRYDFAEADLAAARDVVLSLFGRDRANPSPAVLARILSDSVYGGRVEAAADGAVVDGIVRELVERVVAHEAADKARVFGDGAVDGAVDLPFAAGELAKVVDALPVAAPAKWFGLDASAEVAKEGRAGIASVRLLARMHFGADMPGGARSAPP